MTTKLLNFSLLMLNLGFLQQSALAQSDQGLILNKYGEVKTLSSRDLLSTLSFVAHAYDVRISLETPLSNNTESKSVAANNQAYLFEDGTLESVLNQIVRAYPGFTWSLDEGSIRVVPLKERDKYVTELLDTKIERIVIKKRISALGIGGDITNTPEVQAKLKASGVIGIHVFGSVESMGVDTRSPSEILILNNSAVREILDTAVSGTNARFWTVKRWGNTGEFLTIIVE